LSGLLFSIGLIGLLVKRNAISVFMFVELMLNAVNLTFVAFAVERATQGALVDASAIVLFVITVAAAEAGVGLALFVSIYQNRKNINVDEITALGEAHGDPAEVK
jgi:NADH-quinone oxidoreductase subunit K